MKINSNIDINPRSIEEFVRVMINEALDDKIEIICEYKDDKIFITITNQDNKTIKFNYKNGVIEDEEQAMIKIALLKLYDKKYSWGGLMGVRPTKVVRRLLKQNYNYDEIKDFLQNFMLVKDDKAQILIDVVKKELEFLDNNFINLYIGIPYCPTKCKYCSFASYEIDGGVGRYYNDFIKTLLEEVELTGNFLRKEGFKISSIYIGGGTPSVLKISDLKSLFEAIDKYIDKSYLKEFTFEAGREDTLTKDKIELIAKSSVNRISLNPQTFNENTLKAVNRNFNLENFNKCVELAKKLGLLINMDLIIGLPNETTTDILNTLNKVKNYDIDNLTIHTLAFKRASNLFKESQKRITLDHQAIDKKIKEITQNMNPYYLYRQKNMVEWGENIGYAKNGTESIFNMEMIEENQSTMGVGAGAITKVILSDGKYETIKRYVNPKDPALYIREMKERLRAKIRLFMEAKDEK